MTSPLLGLTVSHYKIIEPLGEGGMGIVYRAEDLKLSRHVALKFLTPGRETDSHMLERFMREARTASALNHPNICTIYEINEHEGTPFIAMELLEGEALERRIDGRPLDVDLVIDYAIQITDALDIAHSAGILHRDIKPANIFVTTRGQVKVLDFGLAKTTSDQNQASLLTDLATELLTTRQGVTLGTVAYMSPEQARGEDLDTRSDLFSFGVVLYEMATGQRTFQGTTSAVVFDAILNREPRAPIDLNANVPATLERIIARALDKDRDRRYQSASEMRADLRRIKSERSAVAAHSRSAQSSAVSPSGANWPSAASGETPVPSRLGGITLWSALVAALGVICLVAAGALFYQSMSRGAEPATAIPATTVATAPDSSAPVAPSGPASAPPVVPTAAAPVPPSPPAAPTTSPTTATTTSPPAAAGTAPAGAAVAPGNVPTSGGRVTGVARVGGPSAPATTPATATAVASAPAAPVVSRRPADGLSEQIRIARAKYDARLYDQALADLKAGISASPSSANAPEAQLLVGKILQQQSRLDDAMAAFVELRQKYATSPEAAEGMFLQAGLVLQSRRDDRDAEARRLYAEITQSQPSSPWAPRALARRAAIEDRMRTRLDDAPLGASVPVSLPTHRWLAQEYPNASEAEASFDRLAEMYEGVRRYDLAAQALFNLVQHFPANNRDAAWRAGELFEKRVKDPQRARESYALVPTRSSHYRDAQKKLQP